MRSQIIRKHLACRLMLAGIATLVTNGDTWGLFAADSEALFAADPEATSELRLPTVHPYVTPTSQPDAPAWRMPALTPPALGPTDDVGTTREPARMPDTADSVGKSGSPDSESGWRAGHSSWPGKPGSGVTDVTPLQDPPAAESWMPTTLPWEPQTDDSVPVEDVIGALAVEGAAGESKTVPVAEYNDLLDRVTSLEDSWDKEQEKIEEAAESAAKKSSWKLSGRVHLDNWNFLDTDAGTNFLETGDVNDDPEDRWDFRRIRLELAGRVPANMLFRTQIDFNNPSSAEMKDVYLGFDGLPHNQMVLIGNQKRPIGMDHLNSSRHNVFAERPLAVETFNEDARRLGVCMYGYTDDEMINWRYGAFLLENISRDGRYRGDFDEAGLYARLAASPWYDDVSDGRGYYHCAIIGSVNQTDADGTLDADDNANEARFRTRPLARSDSRWWNTNRILGADGYQQLGVESVLNIGALQITGEYFGNWVQRDPLGGFNGEDLFFHGGYIFASYFLTGEHIPLNRRAGVIDRVRPFENFFVVDRCCGGTGRGWGALATAFRFDYLDLSDSDIRGGQGYACTYGLNWYWTAYSKLQTNLIWGQIENGGQGQSTTPLASGVDGDFTILGMRYMIDY